MRFSYDLHIHSCLSPCGDNDMTPNNIINMASLLELDIIAVSDHNTAQNLPAIFKVAKSANLTVVPAIEVCTNEEVHILCLFETLEESLNFSDEIYQYLPNIKNDENIFGKQIILDENDCIVGIEDKLLINALTIGIDKLLQIIKSYNAIAIPAHVDKSSNSIISNLGYIPDEYEFSCIELKNHLSNVKFNGKRISNSDAHYLDNINEPINFVDISENSTHELITFFKEKEFK